MREQYSWPGNIRELHNVVHRALLLRKGPRLEASDITFDQAFSSESENTSDLLLEMPVGLTLELMLQRLERQIIENTMRRYNHNKDRVARELDMARSSLFRRLKEWGLGRPGDEEEPE